LIQINHNRYTGHEEQEECHPKTFDTFLTGKCLIEQPDQTQQKGQHIKDVTPCIILQIVGQIGLVSRNMLVDKIEATDPISVLHLSMPLYIVLPSGEVPHEITPIHVVQLIIKEKAKIFDKSRFDFAALFTTIIEFISRAETLSLDLIEVYLAGVAKACEFIMREKI
jgi:hypothetical protein